jgi:serine/threonine-protein kinase RsbW
VKPTTDNGRWRLARTLAPTLEAVDAMCLDVRRRLKGWASAADWYGVELLLREALTNAVLHGGGPHPGRRVRCEVAVGRTKARLSVADDGPGFDWRAVSASEADETATSGRGLKIYAVYADRVTFNEAGNRVVLERHFREASRGPAGAAR